MNIVILKGRLSKDVEIRTTPNNKNMATTTIVVNRDYKENDGSYKVDFFNLIAFGNTAEFLNKHFVKGQEILVNCKVQNRTYEDQSGQKRYTTDFIVNNVEFCGSKKESVKEETSDFITIDDDVELPF